MISKRHGFEKTDLFRAIFVLEKKVSRQNLSKRLGLGEGQIRSILGILKRKKLISSSQKGHFLNEKGKIFLQKMQGFVSLPKKVKLKFYPGTIQVAVLLKSRKNVKISYLQRDIAIKHGAEAALVLKYDQGLYAPGFEYDFKELKGLFDYKKNNILVISFADKERIATNSALAVVLELDKRLGRLV